MSKPVAVLISDVHYNVQTLPLADAALRQAITKSNELKVPLIVAGDLHDTKANMRAECVNAMINAFRDLEQTGYILVGNHDKINEKSTDNALGFLVPLDVAWLVISPCYIPELGMHMIPYQHDTNEFVRHLSAIPKGSTIIMHQGIHGSLSGEYIQDKSAISKDLLADYRVISGHYHTRQDIKCGRPQKGAIGLASYIGNPYTLGFGEVNDPEKGYQILMEDGTLEFVPTNLRKHIIIDMSANKGVMMPRHIAPEDIIKVKFSGTREECAKVTKASIKQELRLMGDFKLELIPLETSEKTTLETKSVSQNEILDSLIDNLSNTSEDQKTRLKTLWKEMT